MSVSTQNLNNKDCLTGNYLAVNAMDNRKRISQIKCYFNYTTVRVWRIYVYCTVTGKCIQDIVKRIDQRCDLIDILFAIICFGKNPLKYPIEAVFFGTLCCYVYEMCINLNINYYSFFWNKLHNIIWVSRYHSHSTAGHRCHYPCRRRIISITLCRNIIV